VPRSAHGYGGGVEHRREDGQVHSHGGDRKSKVPNGPLITEADKHFVILASENRGYKMHFNTDELARIIHSFSFIIFVTYGTAAFAYDPLDCLNDIARADAEIPIGLATRLCSGTWTPEAVKCYQKVSKIDQEIPRSIAIDLCAGTVSAEKTLDCYHQATVTRRQMSRGLATTLCGVRKPEK
jgi:hypothetical protein